MAAGIVVGIVGEAPAEAAVRYAFAEAERTGATVTVVAAGPAPGTADLLVRDLFRRWAEKYPCVESTLSVRRAVDVVVTLAAASRHGDLLVVQRGADGRSAATLAALARLAHCPLRLVDEAPEGAGVACGEPARPVLAGCRTPVTSGPVAGAPTA